MSNAYPYIAIVSGVIVLVLIMILTIFLVFIYFKIIRCDRLRGDSESNVECSGLALDVELPYLTEEQTRRRERAMARYRKNLEKEQRRKALSLRRQEEPVEGPVVEVMSVCSTTSTQETLITRPPPSQKSLENSTVVYGRAEYARHHLLTLMDSEHFCSSGQISVQNTPSRCGSSQVLRSHSSHRGKTLRRRQGVSGQSQAGFLNRGDIDVLDDKNTDSDTASSVVSSLPAPPEVVLGNSVTPGTKRPLKDSDQVGFHAHLMTPRYDGCHSDWSNQDKQSEHTSNALDKAISREDLVSSARPDFAHSPLLQKAREFTPPGCASELVTTKVPIDVSRGSYLPPKLVSTRSTGIIHTKLSSKRLSIRDAEYNITLSGFFTMPPELATTGMPTEPITTPDAPKLETELRCSLAPDVVCKSRQDQLANYTNDKCVGHSPFRSPLSVHNGHFGGSDHSDADKARDANAISTSVSTGKM